MEPIVEVEEGQLKGLIEKDINGTNFFSFLGIPYAEPPIGRLRFKAPVPKKPWTGILNATLEAPPEYCEQLSAPTVEIPFPHLEVQGSEDCLYLNISTRELPNTVKTSLKPVMVFIHGGGFTIGSTTRKIYGPGALLTEDVVLVTVQYRLGCFGFLVLDDVNLGVTGNAGLKDIVLALKWIQNNIRSFLGDPHNVTVFGQSAGGAAVQFLMFSPLAKGLFHKGIAQSGTSLATWAKGRRSNGHLLAEALNYEVDDEEKLLEYLQKLDAAEVYKGQQKLKDPSYADTPRYFSPVVEKPSAEAFITEEPLKILTSGNYNQVPLIMGYNSMEGLLYLFMDQVLANIELSPIRNNVPHDLNLPVDSTNYEKVQQQIEDFYNLKNVEVRNKTTNEIFDLGTDLFFLKDVTLSARLHAKTQRHPVYFYKMAADTGLNYMKVVGQVNFPGACHGDDLGYLFTNIPISVVPGSVEDITRKRLLKLWAQFARTGNPNPKEIHLIGVNWKPIQNDQFNYLEIGKNLTLGVNPDSKRVRFWDEMYKSNQFTGAYLKKFNL